MPLYHALSGVGHVSSFKDPLITKVYTPVHSCFIFASYIWWGGSAAKLKARKNHYHGLCHLILSIDEDT